MMRTFLTSLCLTSALWAQDPGSVRIAFAADSGAAGPGGMVWLRHDVLAQRQEWPTGQDPDAAFTLHLDRSGLRFLAALPLPADAYAAGEGELPDGVTWSFACDREGRDEVTLRAGSAPMQVSQLLEAFRTEIDGAPRVIDVAALVGNLTGPTLEGDDRRALLPLAAARSGELTYSLSRRSDALCIQGRSDGGVFLPLFTLWLAATGPGATAVTDSLDTWRLRAFGSRDGDRAEAVRQLQRAGAQGVAGMRALLHGDEACRLAAIDGLIRLHATDELPRIVAAADATSLLVTDAAALAVRELYADASPRVQQATLRALQESMVLRPDLIPQASPTITAPLRIRLLACMLLVALGLFGLWQRERALLRRTALA